MGVAVLIAGYAENTNHDFILACTLMGTLTIDRAFKGGEFDISTALPNL